MGSFDTIKYKLKRFRKKYYTNMLIRGSILSLGILILLILIPNLLEYNGYFNISVRTALFYGILVLGIIVLAIYVIRPLIKILNWGKTIDDVMAARMIGRYFPGISDKLLNTLQLRDMGENSKQSIQLIEASIEQRTLEMKTFSFQQAVDFRVNRKYLKFLVPIALLFVFILIASPELITEPSMRIVQYNTHFERPAPFSIRIMNDDLSALQDDNFRLEVNTRGELSPERLYLNNAGSRLKFKKEKPDLFTFMFSNLNKDVDFKIQSEEFSSETYTLKVFPRPVLTGFDVLLDYPEYTKKKNEVLENNGEIIVPEGTNVGWKFYTKQVAEMLFGLNGQVYDLEKKNSNVFEFQEEMLQNSRYFFQPKNKFSQNEDTLFYFVNVIKDAYPDIIVSEQQDSSMQSRFFFSGVVKDDYGFEKLSFKYRINESKEKEMLLTQLIDPDVEEQRFYYSNDFKEIALDPGDNMIYYFEIWDNDGVNGSKSTKSKTFSFQLPTKEEISKGIKKTKDEIERSMEEKLIELNMINQEIDVLSRKMLEKKNLDWNEKSRIEDLLKRQNKLQTEIEDLVKENKKANQKRENENLIENQQLMEKQRKIEEMLEQVLDEETKALLKKLQEMLEKMNKEDVMEMMEKIKMSNEEMEQNLDRNLEMLKQFEYEKMLNEITEKLKQLSEKEKELSEANAKKEMEKDAALKEQEKVGKDFEQLQKEIEELKKKNQELESKNKEFDSESLEQEIQKDMQESMENMQNSKMNDASESQKNASQKMQKMSQAMMEAFNSGMQESTGEDMKTVREILENLIETSYDQEELISKIDNVNPRNPAYVNIMQEQNSIKDNMLIVEDSLKALAKRQMAIQPYVTKEIADIKTNLRKVNENLKERRTALVARDQQYVMTAVNNLALLLAEALQQMQNSMNMQSSASSKGSCSKPGGKGSTAKSLKQWQKQLNESMQKMQQGMEGKGQHGKRGKNSLSEQFARMAAEQAQIRKRMQEYMDQLEEQGVKAGGMGEIMQEMEKTEEELVNKILNNETMKRQKDILTRLLKSEKAEMEREKKKERESKESKNVKRSNPDNFLEYKRMKTGDKEFLKTVNPELKRFYQKRVNEYFHNSGIITNTIPNGSSSD
ncbi:MAG: hypothetical protein K9G47_01070 [Bacteroidales bacterium]|nr:hypothetical protein [Bacteroidales bacterium]